MNLGSMAHVFLRTLVPVLATLDLDLKRFNDLHECALFSISSLMHAHFLPGAS